MKILAINILEKHIRVIKRPESPHLSITFNRINIVPPELNDAKFNASIRLEMTILDNNSKTELAKGLLHLTFLADLEEQNYDKETYINLIFDEVKPMFYSEFQHLLRDIDFPPMPFSAFIP